MIEVLGIVYAFGDSITFGVGADWPYLNAVSAYYDAPRINKGISGSQAAHQANAAIYGTQFTPNDVSLFLTGYNDMRYFGASSDQYQASLKTILAYMGTSARIDATAMTAGGTWLKTPVNPIGRYTTTPGSTLSTTVSGSVVYVASMQMVGVAGTYKITINGVDYGPYDTSGGAVYNTGSWNPVLRRIEGLPLGPKTVTVTHIAGQTFVDWVGSPAPSQRVYVAGCLKMPPAAYGLWPPFNKGSDAIAEQYTAIIQAEVDAAAADGLRVSYVDVGPDFDVTKHMAADAIHPEDSGQMSIAVSFMRAIGLR
jgi:hypothetical protein